MGDTNDDKEEQEELSPGDLRRMLAEEKQRNKEHAAQLAAFQQDEQLRDAGYGHLTKRQRGTLLRELAADGKDFSPENVAELAGELGFPTTAPGRQSSSNGEGEPDPEAVRQAAESQESLDSLSQMEIARRAAASNQGSPELIGLMKAAGSKEELRGVIRDKGPRQGIIHEWDVP